MWYYTRHSLSIEDNPTKEKSNQEIFEEIKADENIWYGFYELDEFWESIKGYDLEHNLKEFSKKYPNKIFRIKWEWEENYDIWEMVICNWKSKI